MKSMPGNDMTGMERRLLRFGEKIDGISVEHHAPDHLDRHDFLGNDFRRIEHVEIEAVGLA